MLNVSRESIEINDDQHDDNEDKLGAAQSDEDIEYDEDDYSKVDNDDKDNDDVYGNGNEED